MEIVSKGARLASLPKSSAGSKSAFATLIRSDWIEPNRNQWDPVGPKSIVGGSNPAFFEMRFDTFEVRDYKHRHGTF